MRKYLAVMAVVIGFGAVLPVAAHAADAARTNFYSAEAGAGGR